MNGVVVSELAEIEQRQSCSLPSVQMTVFCDFDGPILDVSDRYYNTYQLGLADVQAHYQEQGQTLPIHRLSKAQFWQMKQNRVPDPEIALRSGLHGKQIDLFLQRVQQIVNQPTLLHQDRLQPGVAWALALLHAHGVRLVLVTLRCRTQAMQVLQSYGLMQWFSSIWGASDAEAAYLNSSQHKTQLLAQAVAACGWQETPAHAAWMIGDTEADVLAGQAFALPTIALTCGIRSRAYLSRFTPTRVHTDLLTAAHDLLAPLSSDRSRSIRPTDR